MTRVKICGITREADAELAAALGAHAVGLVFWPRSPRAITVSRAREIVRALPPFVTPVGVFVDADVDTVRSTAGEVGLAAVQLHGDERVGDYASLTWPILRAIPLGHPDEAGRMTEWRHHHWLLDRYDSERRGGTGETVSWARAATIARERPVVLAGGLTAANVAEAIACVRPAAVDVSSGVELSPGQKDPARLRAFIAAVQGAKCTEAVE